MTKTKAALAGLFAAASLAGVAVGAHAQMAAQGGAPAARADKAGPAAQDLAARQARMEERRAQHDQALHDVLAITPSQEGAWRAYVAATKRPARSGPERGPRGGDRAEMQRLTTPQRLDRMAAEANQRHSEMLARINATKTFYAQLSAAQQKAFDALPGFGGHDRGGIRGPGHGGRGGRGGGHMGPGFGDGPDQGGGGRGRGGDRGPGPRGPQASAE